ncbi:hypothetical protein XO10_04735 [Marinitoga sp. 1135]|uniref:Flagella basal body P-ring formation protein FlgA n=1 Tax=Marinitoga piezophila (strain DSM 14283 / JCM 11233 / KA3) TaxID=443254 RepID=H2J7R1_MARPK|nr:MULTISPECIES: flagellar basal body P-ring formation chaperone FlgA [Marinitoga]AEX85402.1 flagella basal body P-ring formation protein FlgA [Marinitoga piezophila KA3]APT75877.1 hypothetical protein LN42_05420 [Marinitoga sp. 1137]NUU95588.1 hypothetical protein [Marinitoga sp. 1135]NUU97532.1 hypothetical protein [Marinitoga sp. 1138]
MKHLKFLSIVFLIYLSTFIFANNQITLPASIISIDNIFSLKDIFPEIKNDRTLAFFTGETITYDASKLKNMIESLTNYENITFESTIITIFYMPTKTKNNSNLNKNDTKYILEDYFKNIFLEDSKTATINSFEISKFYTDTKVSTVLDINYRRTMNNVFGNFLILDDFNNKKYISFKANVSNYKNVFIAKNNIDYKTPLNDSLLATKTVDIYSLNFSPLIVEKKDLIKFQANRKIRKNEIIYENSVKKIPDVKAGQIIPVEVYAYGVKILSWMRVLNDAIIGEIVSGRNEKTGVLITGKLYKGPKVIIDIGGN